MSDRNGTVIECTKKVQKDRKKRKIDIIRQENSLKMCCVIYSLNTVFLYRVFIFIYLYTVFLYRYDPTQSIQDVCNIPLLPISPMGVEPTNGESAYRTALFDLTRCQPMAKELAVPLKKCNDE
jgi:hypothetical protein